MSDVTSALDFSQVEGAIVFEGLGEGGAVDSTAAVVFPTDASKPITVYGARLHVGSTEFDVCGP